ncbi:hypothetical protein PUNSTDRAFT_54012 [Punctularia strigosozonata HHB-11173 SS5]|uniref:uncharacterized protein n=1 Tax=Punctularia strigosozonata (strain HHB-11173) TaxID=741275 RepID=UPI00044176D7|nr:uncharacterized protein PUNSTDRAFT_54012 [Punctularia strigosozonata HHB-11173 SS5]EIN06597.1 hypothetical protein PUNSTDRAFT_54012 [Punctularia strigosozonata HHB-11173 SS5]
MAPPLADILHRGVTTTLAAITVWGLYAGVSIHQDTLRRGRELVAKQEAEAAKHAELGQLTHLDEAREQALAEAATNALLPSSKSA